MQFFVVIFEVQVVFFSSIFCICLGSILFTKENILVGIIQSNPQGRAREQLHDFQAMKWQVHARCREQRLVGYWADIANIATTSRCLSKNSLNAFIFISYHLLFLYVLLVLCSHLRLLYLHPYIPHKWTAYLCLINNVSTRLSSVVLAARGCGSQLGRAAMEHGSPTGGGPVKRPGSLGSPGQTGRAPVRVCCFFKSIFEASWNTKAQKPGYVCLKSLGSWHVQGSKSCYNTLVGFCWELDLCLCFINATAISLRRTLQVYLPSSASRSLCPKLGTTLSTKTYLAGGLQQTNSIPMGLPKPWKNMKKHMKTPYIPRYTLLEPPNSSTIPTGSKRLRGSTEGHPQLAGLHLRRLCGAAGRGAKHGELRGLAEVLDGEAKRRQKNMSCFFFGWDSLAYYYYYYYHH